MKSFHFNIGNSSTGSLGLCARVIARDESQAVDILQRALTRVLDSEESVPISTEPDSVEYVHVYINTDAITTDSIDMEDEVEDLDGIDPDADQRALNSC